MNHEEMLRHLSLTQQELYDLLRKFTTFFESLDPAQKAAVRRSLPSAESAAKTLGEDVSAEELQRFLTSSNPHPDANGGTFMFEGALHLKNRE